MWIFFSSFKLNYIFTNLEMSSIQKLTGKKHRNTSSPILFKIFQEQKIIYENVCTRKTVFILQKSQSISKWNERKFKKIYLNLSNCKKQIGANKRNRKQMLWTQKKQNKKRLFQRLVLGTVSELASMHRFVQLPFHLNVTFMFHCLCAHTTHTVCSAYKSHLKTIYSIHICIYLQ